LAGVNFCNQAFTLIDVFRQMNGPSQVHILRFARDDKRGIKLVNLWEEIVVGDSKVERLEHWLRILPFTVQGT
jgi:hypothetical protein